MTAVTYESELERSGKIVFTVKGVSMLPLFRTGSDAIIVRKCTPDELKNLDIVLFKRMSAQGVQYVLHRIVGKRPDGLYIIAGDNCIGVDIVRPEDILGVVASAQRRSRPIRLDGFRYNMYKTLWCRPFKMRSFLLRSRNRARAVLKKSLSPER